MPLLAWFARRWFLRRLFYGPSSGRRRPRSSPYLARGLQPRGGRVGLFGPVPYYSGRTRRGARVSVGGCCLPIPLLFVASLFTGLRLLLTRR